MKTSHLDGRKETSIMTVPWLFSSSWKRTFVMAKSFKLADAKGNENEEAHHYFDQAWFKQMLEYALAANLWGHSLIELGDLTTDGDGCPCYTDVKLIPRKHVIPEYGRVIQQLGQDWTMGIDYHSAPFSDWLIEAGRPDDLGLYLKAATQTIPKKNILGFLRRDFRYADAYCTHHLTRPQGDGTT